MAKLWLAFTALVFIVMVPLEFALGSLLTDFYKSQVTEPLLYHSETLAEMLAADPTVLPAAPLMGRMVGGEVIVLDAGGDPVAFSGASSTPPPDIIRQALNRKVPIADQVLLDTGEPYIVTAVPIPSVGGVVSLLAPARPVQQSLSLARRYLWLAGAGTLLLGTGLALMLARGLIRPLIGIEQATEKIAQGDFSTRVPVHTHDEVGQLAEAVNQMTGQLEGYEQRRREFLANVAHELRTPLSYIRGYSQAVAEGLVPAEDQNRYLRLVQEESVRIGRLVDDLMDLAQIDEGQMSFQFTPLDVAEPFEQAVAVVGPMAQQKGVTVRLDLPESRPLIRADGGRIQQVIVNLLDNALRHTPEHGEIRVTVAAQTGFLTARVADTGEGIPPEQLPLVFERFHKQRSSGRGLGLAIARSIIRAHGGEIGVSSLVGHGTEFWFRLPTAA